MFIRSSAGMFVKSDSKKLWEPDCLRINKLNDYKIDPNHKTGMRKFVLPKDERIWASPFWRRIYVEESCHVFRAINASSIAPAVPIAPEGMFYC